MTRTHAQSVSTPSAVIISGNRGYNAIRKPSGFAVLFLFTAALAVYAGSCENHSLLDYVAEREKSNSASSPQTATPAVLSGMVEKPIGAVMTVVTFQLANDIQLGSDSVWQVYEDIDTEVPSAEVRAAAAGTSLFLFHDTDVPAGTWYASVTEPGRSESGRLALTVVGQYSITYHPEGGTLPEGMPETYRTDEPSITLRKLDWGTNDFLGWYDNALLQGSPVQAISAGSSGDREFWAAWQGHIDLTSPDTSGVGWTRSGNVITIKDGADVGLYGSTTVNRVVVEDGAAATVTLQDAAIDLSGGSQSTASASSVAFDIGLEASVTMLLSGTSTLKSSGGGAGIHVSTGRTLIIDSAASAGAETGVLEVTGGYSGAGIGGSQGENAGSIRISGGTVTASGTRVAGNHHNAGAGIGGGGRNAANGGADGGMDWDIVIAGGIVNAYGGSSSLNSDEGAAGIGGGGGAANTIKTAVGSVRISGGTVNAYGGQNSAGIGGAIRQSAGTITVSGGTVYAEGGRQGAGIGSGFHANEGIIRILGGTVTARAGFRAAGIGGGCNHSGSNTTTGTAITISGGTVDAKGDSEGAGIGAGHNGIAGTITISGTSSGKATSGASVSIPIGGQNGGGSFSGPNGETSWPTENPYTWGDLAE